MPKPESFPAPTRSAAAGGRPWFGDLNQADFEIEFFENLTQRSPTNIRALRLLGERLARKGLYDRCLEVDRKLVNLVPQDCVVRYNLACTLAMNGAAQQAIEELGRAIDHGYTDWQHLEVDPDLDGIRAAPAYRDLLRRLRPDSR